MNNLSRMLTITLLATPLPALADPIVVSVDPVEATFTWQKFGNSASGGALIEMVRDSKKPFSQQTVDIGQFNGGLAGFVPLSAPIVVSPDGSFHTVLPSNGWSVDGKEYATKVATKDKYGHVTYHNVWHTTGTITKNATINGVFGPSKLPPPPPAPQVVAPLSNSRINGR